MITIDGSEGEGGGQILRTALSLSVATGKPFTIRSIRVRRTKPGLMRQHLTAVKAAAEISGARVEGAEVGATSLVFSPGPVKAGDYVFRIGSAGSTTLVLQTVLPPLAIAGAPSRIVIEGGTHNMGAPPFEFLDRAFLPLIRRMGFDVTARLTRHGFYPAGGGMIEVGISRSSWKSERRRFRGRPRLYLPICRAPLPSGNWRRSHLLSALRRTSFSYGVSPTPLALAIVSW
jgi:RNA 3'-terminal phosphate cyclase (ATP)